MELKGKVAVITGSGRGLGKAMALAMAAEGADVVVNDIDSEPVEEVIKEIKAKGGKAVGCVVDIGTMQSGREVVQCAVDTFGKIDILVNNAGVFLHHSLLETPEEDWDEELRVHLKGTFACCKAAAKYMVQQKSGHIINVASNAARWGNPGECAYAAAKGGVIGFTKSIARDLGPYNILVNAITPMAETRQLESRIKEQPEFMKQLLSLNAMGRLGKREEVAAMVVFLASDRASYSTGQVFDVTGGRYM